MEDKQFNNDESENFDNIEIESDNFMNKDENCNKKGMYKNINDNFNNIINDVIKSKYNMQNNGNIETQNVFYISNMTGDILSVKEEQSNVSPNKNEKKYELYNVSDCKDFVSKYEVSLHLAYAISISLFGYVPISNLQNLSKRLLRHFPEKLDGDGKKDETNCSPFLSLDNILSVIGAEICHVTYSSRFKNIEVRCVCFPQHKDKIIKNIWEQYPMLRSIITTWLIEADFISQFRDAFGVNRFVEAIANLVKLDFEDSVNRLFPQLTSNPSNKYLLTKLFIILTNDPDTQENANIILKQWSSSSKWLWEIPLAVLSSKPKDLPFPLELEHTVGSKLLNCFNNKDDDSPIKLISFKMISSPKLRSMVASVFEKLFRESKEKHNETSIAVIYLVTVINAYTFIDNKNIILPLVVFDTKQQLKKIKPIILKIIADFPLRKGLFYILEVYINEINNYEISDSLMNGLKSFFYILGKEAPKYYNDIIRFLKQIKNKTANDIIKYLQEKVRKELLTL